MCHCISAQANKNKDNNRHWCLGVLATVKLRQAMKRNTHFYPIWVWGKKTGNTWTNEIDNTDRVRMNKNRELVEVSGRRWDWSQTLWANVMETETVMCHMVRHCFLVQHAGTYMRGMRREIGRELRAPYRLCVMKTWTAHRCAGKPNEIERTEVERIMLWWRFNIFYWVQILLIYKIDYTASTHRKPIIYCATHNHKGKEQRKS